MNCLQLSQSALHHNIDILQTIRPNVSIWPTLNSNAYGHGLIEIAKMLSDQTDIERYVVQTMEEALRLRQYTSKPILTLGYVPPIQIKLAISEGIEISVHSVAYLKNIMLSHESLKFHIMCNTGLNRMGIKPNEIDEVLEIIKDMSVTSLVGLYSHLADSDHPLGDNTFTNTQQSIFAAIIDTFEQSGILPPYVHCEASGGLPKIQDTRINAARTGISIYGYSPLSKNDSKYNVLHDLQPVLAFNSTVVGLHELQVGERVGYNGTFEVVEPTLVAVIPVGYHEGCDRRNSNNGYIQFGKKYLPIIGNVSMNFMAVNATGTNISVGDDVCIISNDPHSPVSAKAIAERIGTIDYEVLTKLSGDITRQIVWS